MHFNTVKSRAFLVGISLAIIWIASSTWLYFRPQKTKDWLILPIQNLIYLPDWLIVVLFGLFTLLIVLLPTGLIFMLPEYIKTGFKKTKE